MDRASPGRARIARLQTRIALNALDGCPDGADQLSWSAHAHWIEAFTYIVQHKYDTTLECIVEAEEAATQNSGVTPDPELLSSIGFLALELVCAAPFTVLSSRLDVVSGARSVAPTLSDDLVLERRAVMLSLASVGASRG